MRIPEPWIEATLLKRYQRFLVDAQLHDGSIITAHCANSGSMLGLIPPGASVLLSAATGPSRRTAWTLEWIRLPESWVGVHTGRTNALVAEALSRDVIPELAGYSEIRPETHFDRHTRLDFRLRGSDRPDCWLEVKSVTLRQGHQARFPDAVTRRGRHHLEILQQAVLQGMRAVQLFVVQRGDCQGFAPAAMIDPAYSDALHQARRQGVEILAYDCVLQPPEWSIRNAMALDF
ncbi:MAG: DNA/RNA nuclease SfsA [Magnetococcales bacterium]|nr:DNA/RNA nuclease SfsA [Magnetococcales bacterium]